MLLSVHELSASLSLCCSLFSVRTVISETIFFASITFYLKQFFFFNLYNSVLVIFHIFLATMLHLLKRRCYFVVQINADFSNIFDFSPALSEIIHRILSVKFLSCQLFGGACCLQIEFQMRNYYQLYFCSGFIGHNCKN